LLHLLTGDSLVSIHAVSGFADAALIFVSAMIARELGGRRNAQIFAAIVTLFCGTLAFGAIFSMDIFDALWWSLLAYILVRIIRRDEPRLFVAFGVVMGIALNTKLTVAFFILALSIGLALTSKRRYFKSKWLWIGVAISIIFILPFVAWNAFNGWPTVDFYFHHGGLNGSGPLDFLALQFLITNPAAFPLVLLGLYFFLKVEKVYRVLGLAYLILLFAFLFLNGKPYFLAAAYPMLFAGGAVFLEKSTFLRRHGIIPKAYIGTIVVVGIILAPLLMPILPPATFASSYGSLSGLGNSAAAQNTNSVFPQYLGDRFGWNTMTVRVAQVYNSLPPQEKSEACIFASNYGEASALIFLGANYDLPHVISGHNNYYIWGPGSCSGQVIIIVGLTQSDDLKSFYNVSAAAIITCEYCQPNENNLTIYICTNPKVNMGTVWPELKDFS
jgi:4-amino-4-deoxy-L-arabinose transferase-like glycosyltransferase